MTPATGSTVSLQANKFFFAPTCVTDLSAGTATLSVHSAGRALHNLTVQSLRIDKGRAGRPDHYPDRPDRDFGAAVLLQVQQVIGGWSGLHSHRERVGNVGSSTLIEQEAG